jgi:hypothetical protein
MLYLLLLMYLNGNMKNIGIVVGVLAILALSFTVIPSLLEIPTIR